MYSVKCNNPSLQSIFSPTSRSGNVKREQSFFSLQSLAPEQTLITSPLEKVWQETLSKTA